VAPLRLGGLRGKQSTPSDWLGGTGEVSTVGEQERHVIFIIVVLEVFLRPWVFLGVFLIDCWGGDQFCGRFQFSVGVQFLLGVKPFSHGAFTFCWAFTLCGRYILLLAYSNNHS
jgi:hypothetical protein